MTALNPYWKLVQFVLLALGGGFAVAIHDGHIYGHEWANLGVLAAGAVALFFARNTPTQPNAKRVVAVFAAGVAVLVSAWTDGLITSDEWVQIALALIAAANVKDVANVPPGAQPEATVTDISREDVDRAIYGDTTRPHRPGATDGEW